MKFINLILFILCIVYTSFAQSIEGRINLIKNRSDLYYFAEGEGKNYKEATMDALNKINMQITVYVKSDFENSYDEYIQNNQGNRFSTIEEYTHSKINTYSEMTFNDAKLIELIKRNNYYKGFWYIEKSNIKKIFDNRKNMIFTHVKLADNFKNKLNIRDALKHYYWAFALLKSHPDCTSLTDTSSNPDYKGLILTETIKQRIQYILSNLCIKATTVKTTNNILVALNIQFEGKPVKKIEYEYWYLNKWQRDFVSDENGVSVIRISKDYPINYVRIKPKFIYNQSFGSDHDLKMALENIGTVIFDDIQHDVEFNETQERKIEVAKDNVNIVTNRTDETNAIAKYETILNQIMIAIDSKLYDSISNYFTSDGYKMFDELIKRGDAIIYKKIDTLRLLTTGFETEVRSIPMSFMPANGQESFIENVNFTFNSDDKITSLSFSLSKTALSDILNKSEGFASEKEKYQIIHFMENYKTAYCLKRLDYIESIFDNDALIIVGNLVKKTNTTDNIEYKLKGNIEYKEMNKQEYIENLRNVFKENQFVNIYFENNKVKKLEKNRIIFENGEKKIIPIYDKIYGIQISQEYYSTNYADKGYLFLLFDVRDSLHPKIHIRTWQPKRDSNGKIIGLNDWNF